MKVGDTIKCISGHLFGYGGKIAEINSTTAQVAFYCSECEEKHTVFTWECKLIKPIYKGHPLTDFFKKP